jgi:PEP-CTERM motif
MRRYRSAIPVLFLFVAGPAYADNIQTFQITSATIEIMQFGSVAVDLIGPGINVSGDGGIDCGDWCNGENDVPDGTELNLGDITLHQLRVEIGGNTFDESQGALLAPFFINTFGPLFAPSSGGAAILNNNGIVVGQAGTGSNFVQFRLKTPPGDLELDFNEGTFARGRYIGMTTVVPEPATLGLMATGLAGIVGLVRRKRGCART